MTELFLDIVNMSISAGWLILVVLALRLIMKKTPKWVNVLLWGIVAVRLICPFSIESTLSLIPSTETISPEIMLDRTPEISTGIQPLDQVINPVISDSFAPDASASANPLQILIPVAANIWLLGVLILLAYTAISYLTLRHKLRTAVILKDNLFQCETVSSPFVLGMLKPRIYLPYALDGNDLDYVVAHEQAHIRRFDHWWKPLGFLLLTIHWFNPFVWIAYILLCRDIELACDEKVIAELGHEQRADYTQALVACSVNRRMIAACPLAFGEVGVKERVKSIMNYRKPTFWIILIAVTVCGILAVCFLTNPLDSVDYLMYTIQNNDPVEPDRMFYEINLGNQAMSGHIYVEEWSKGTCVRSAPVDMTQYVDSIDVSIRDRWDGGVKVGTDIHIETNQYGGSLTTYFPYPENYDGAVYFAQNEVNKLIRLSPGKEVILEARSFQCGNGLRPFTCETLIFNREILDTADYMIVIRAVFSEDPLEVTEEEALSTPHTVLKAKVLEIHDGYFLVEPVEGSLELNSTSRIEVSMKNMHPSPEPQEGDILEIEYDGLIQEVFPARITGVYSIRVLESGELQGSTYEIYNVAPLEELPETYNLEEATIDKCVIIVDGDIRDNVDSWTDFINDVEANGNATVRIVHYYHSSDTEPSFMLIFDLTYDGKAYQLRWFEDGEEYVRSYQYLRHFSGEAELPGASYDAYESYILTNDITATRLELLLSYASSVYGAAIPHHEIYTDLIYYPDYPEIPSALTKADLYTSPELESHEMVLVASYDEEEMLTRLHDLLSSAQAIGFIPKTYGICYDLVLTGEDGATVTLGLDAESDLIVIDGVFYDYGPGYDEDGSLDATMELLSLLGLDAWK